MARLQSFSVRCDSRRVGTECASTIRSRTAKRMLRCGDVSLVHYIHFLHRPSDAETICQPSHGLRGDIVNVPGM